MERWIGEQEGLDEGLDAAYMARLLRARVADAVLVDVIAAYADAHFPDEDQREAFMSSMTEPPLGPQVRKAILDIIFSVTAAAEVPTDSAFRALVNALGVGEALDEQVHDVQQTMLATMREDSDIEQGGITEPQFLARLDWVRDRLTTG